MTPSHEGLRQMVEQNDEKHLEGHVRLRKDLRELEQQVDAGFQSLRESHAALRMKIATMETTPVDAGKLMVTPRIVVTIVALSLSIAGGVWASTSGLRSDVRDILTRMETQRSVSDVRDASMRESIEAMKRRQELQQYEIQGLKEMLLTGKARTR